MVARFAASGMDSSARHDVVQPQCGNTDVGLDMVAPLLATLAKNPLPSENELPTGCMETKSWYVPAPLRGRHSGRTADLCTLLWSLQHPRTGKAGRSSAVRMTLPLDEQIAAFLGKEYLVASFATVRHVHGFHVVNCDEDNIVTAMETMHDREIWVNGGFFVFRQGIFDYIKEHDELVEAPFARLIAQRKIGTYRWRGFWHCMDTFKDKLGFDRMTESGQCPWMVWQDHSVKTTPSGYAAAKLSVAPYSTRSGSTCEPA